MSNVDWKAEIARIAYWKQRIADNDPQGAFPWHLPKLGATPPEISATERAIGFSFPPEFAEFLSYANGWRAFCVLTDLFGTEDFLEGRHKKALARRELQEFTAELGITGEHFVVIGASDFDLDVYLLFSANSPFLPGGTLWFASEEVDRFYSFSEFFSSMVNYNARIADRLAPSDRE